MIRGRICESNAVTELIVHFSIDGERSVLRLTGELDIDSAAELRQHAQAELAAGRCRTLTLDMSGLTFIDSSGLGLLIELRRLAGMSEVTLELTNVPPGPARVIAIAGLSETFGLPAAGGRPDDPAT
jgi:anti-anti-sigma factor